MVLNVSPNKVNPIPQSLNFDDNKIVTLVGENGSGKSKILEKVFEDYVINPDVTLVSFTSGQNECFSSIFVDHLSRSRRSLIESYMTDRLDENTGQAVVRDLGLNTFHFDPSWVRLLIFFATTIKPNGRVRQFLLDRDYVTVSNDILNDDLTTNISFRFRILTPYIRKVQAAILRESEDYSYSSIRKSIMHELLEKLATFYEEDFDFTEPTYLKWRKLTAPDAITIFGRDVRSIFTFLLYALTYNTFIEKDTIKINFKGNLELNSLSDGEFQMLSIYALVDLFDSSTTLFLFDEIDSHVHYTNTQKLWAFLKNIQGNLLTTTHSADSIISHSPKSIRLVSAGKVEEELTAEHIFKRLTFLTESESYKFKVAAKFEYLALVENKFDWFLFLELAKKKIQAFDSSIFKKIQVVERSSTTNYNGTDFGIAKINWIKELLSVERRPNCKAIFMICDRDTLNIATIQSDGVSVPFNDQVVRNLGTNRQKSFLLSWKRREIENYLIGYTLLENKNILQEITQRVAPTFCPTASYNCDNTHIQDLDVKQLLQPLYIKTEEQIMDTHERYVDFDKVTELVNLLPADEISEDIKRMYDFIVLKMTT